MEDDNSTAVAAPNPPPKKRLLFAKKLNAQRNEAEEAVDFFSRSHEIFPQNLAEEERKRQKRIAKLERKRSSTSVEIKEPSPHEEKKRRISEDHYSSEEEPEEASRTRRDSTHSTPGSRKSRSASAQKNQASPTSLAGRYSRDLRAGKKENSPAKAITNAYITLSDSDEEDIKPLPARTQPIMLDDDDIYSIPEKPKRKPVVVDADLSDEEFPELVQQARERELLHKLQREKASKSFTEQNHSTDDDVFETESSIANTDPVVEILISSQINGSKPVLAKRKLSQRLKEVKMAWSDHQRIDGKPMAPEVKDSIFLTWKLKRLYDVSTCKSLGLSVDSSGNIASQGDGVDNNGRVHLEAWDEETFQAYQNQLAAELKREQDGINGKQEAAERVAKIKLTLKSRELGDFRITTTASHPVQRLITAFRQEKKVSEDKEISLHVDGDKLDPEDKIEDTELEDMDAVEVHIR
ncbi:DNA repair protein rad60 [Lachnellula suecica]|uniref:DNA repair protein rad60 n=1 Tax=Lachnellula suecica TaxID=602035 RepID=A0A8T9BY48_9HELO|nr:DNA repair protein rad60 [Lachnellula suecica]